MKILALASVVASIVICPVSEARSLKTYDNYVLRHVSINGVNEGLIAEVHVNYIESKINVSIVKDICGHYADLPPNTFRCMAAPMPRAQLEVPMLKRGKDGCGSFVVSGMEEKRPVDGNRTEITVTNHTHRMCDDIVRSQIEVHAETISLRGGKTVYDITM